MQKLKQSLEMLQQVTASRMIAFDKIAKKLAKNALICNQTHGCTPTNFTYLNNYM